MGAEKNRKAVTTEHRAVRQIPWSETCFGCNGGANEGVGLRLAVTDDGYVACVCRTKECHQGFPGYVHGGIIATYFDEVLWGQTLLCAPESSAMTVEMDIRYLAAVKTGQEVRIVAEPARVDGRHIYVDGFLLLPDDTIAVTASAHYITVKKSNDLTERETERTKHEEEPEYRTIRF